MQHLRKYKSNNVNFSPLKIAVLSNLTISMSAMDILFLKADKSMPRINRKLLSWIWISRITLSILARNFTISKCLSHVVRSIIVAPLSSLLLRCFLSSSMAGLKLASMRVLGAMGTGTSISCGKTNWKEQS